MSCPTCKGPMVTNLFGDATCPDCAARPQFRNITVVRRKLPTDPAWFRVGRQTPESHILNVRAGRHPLGAALKAPGNSTCGSCQHLVRVAWSQNTYLKCGLMRAAWTHSPRTDLRRKWPGCEHWSGKEAE